MTSGSSLTVLRLIPVHPLTQVAVIILSIGACFIDFFFVWLVLPKQSRDPFEGEFHAIFSETSLLLVEAVLWWKFQETDCLAS